MRSMRQWLGSSARWHIAYDYPPAGVGRMSQSIEQVEPSASAVRSWPGARLTEERQQAEVREDLWSLVWLLVAMAICVACGIGWCYVGAVLLGGAR